MREVVSACVYVRERESVCVCVYRSDEEGALLDT